MTWVRDGKVRVDVGTATWPAAPDARERRLNVYARCVHAACTLNEIRTLRWTDGAVIASVTLAGLGLAATTGVTAVFWRHNDTPVVKASTRAIRLVLVTRAP